MITRELLDKIAREHPLEDGFESEARYIWPKRWEEIYSAVDESPTPACPAHDDSELGRAVDGLVGNARHIGECLSAATGREFPPSLTAAIAAVEAAREKRE